MMIIFKKSIFSSRNVLVLTIFIVSLGFVNAAAAILGIESKDRKVTETTEFMVCTVTSKSFLESGKPLYLGKTPIDSLKAETASCSSTFSGADNLVAGGVMLLLAQGYRLASASHQVTPLHRDSEGRTELLVTAVFVLERVRALGTR